MDIWGLKARYCLRKTAQNRFKFPCLSLDYYQAIHVSIKKNSLSSKHR